MENLIIQHQVINQYDDLYSLNDLHKASGGSSKHKPSNFMRNEEVQALIKEIEQVSDLRLGTKSIAYKIIHGGSNNGTYVCKELVYRYAMWISASFSLHVIRAFEASTQQPVTPEIPQTLPEALRLAADMAEKNQALTQQIEEQAPLVNLAERCLLLGKNLCLRDAAKIAGMSPKQFNLALLEHKFIYRTVNNELRPYQQAINKDLMQAKYHFYINSKGEESMSAQPLITPYGLQEILRFLGIKSPSIPNF